MIGGFQLRLFAGFTVVIVLSLGTVSLYVMQGTEQEIEVYEELTDQLYLTRMEHWLLGYHARGESWDDVRGSVEEMGVLSGRRIVLTDPDDEVIVDSRHVMVGSVFESDWPNRALRSSRDGTLLGTVYVGPESSVATAYTQDLARSIGFFLFWGSLVACAAALVLTAMLARRMSKPIHLLVDAARQIGTGDFSGEVSIREKGEFRELAAAFNGMARDLERVAAFRKNLVADIAHELRTPLANIRGYIEAVEDGLVSADDAVATFKDDAVTLHRLVEDLQELAMADAGSLPMIYRLLDPRAVAERVVNAMKNTAAAEGIALQISGPETELPELVADAQRIQQVLGNLVENAIMHTARGGTVTIVVDGEPGAIVYAVEDTGTGIPEDDLDRIFDRFHRVDTSRTRATGGSGLGLTISRQLVEAHGGSIAVVNRAEGGSRFTVRLPLIPG